MSASFALIKFKRTGNIYYGCYEGTSDMMIPYICTPEECYDEKLDCYCSIIYCRDLGSQHKQWIFPTDIEDLDEVEIYSDYGGGFYWSGVGSESIKMIDSPVDEWGQVSWDKITDGRPEWVARYIEELGGDE